MEDLMMFRTFLLSAFFVQMCFATDITVTVWCNGVTVREGVEISVYDANYTPVTGISTTNQDGQFVIENAEDYVEPFSMFFTADNGSTCGAYSVGLSSPTEGTVQLAYYPTGLSCSCSHLINEE